MLSKHGFTPTSVETLGSRLSMNFNIIRTSSIKNKFLRLIQMLSVVFINRKARFVLIDTYSSSAFWFAVIVSLLSKILGISFILILRGGNLPNRITSSPLSLRFLLKNAYKVVCPSNYLKSEMNKFYSRNYCLIPNYIDLENYTFKERNKDNAIKLLWVRAFHKIYNPLLAVDIVESLKQLGYDVKLAMIGPDKDGSLLSTKKYAKAKNVDSNIIFTGKLDKKQWIEFSKNYDFFINTTDIDNTPVSVMEAMALGMVIISTNVGGIPFLCENNTDAILVSPKNPNTFVKNIIKVKEDLPFSKKLSKNARIKAEKWDWNVVKQDWIKLLSSKT